MKKEINMALKTESPVKPDSGHQSQMKMRQT